MTRFRRTAALLFACSLALLASSLASGQPAPGPADPHAGHDHPPAAPPPGRGRQGGPQMAPRRVGPPSGMPNFPNRPPPPGRHPGATPPPGGHGHGAEKHGGQKHGDDHGGAAHHCPGHGPLDAPHHPNWWHGLLMVNNERAQAGGFANQLLFRYENDKDPCDPKNEPPPFLASVLNFGALAYLVVRFGKKPLADALVKRRESIMGEIENATRLREEAEARLVEYEEKFENIQDKLEELRAEYAALAETEKKHVLAEAEERRVRMRKDAEFRIEQELKQARVELLREAVESAVVAAEELLRKRVQQQDLERMANDYLKAIGPSVAEGKKATRLGAGVAS